MNYYTLAANLEAMRRQLLSSWDTLRGEHLKTAAEFSLHNLAKNPLGHPLIYLARGGKRFISPRLKIKVAGIEFENPLMVGAGWDKRGKAVDGLYLLGFAGTEVGTILPHPQPGNPRPRLFVDRRKSVSLNSFGFNNSGARVVKANLSRQKRRGVVGINVGKNKALPDELAPQAHASVVEQLYKLGDYFVINLSSPNTPGLRANLNPEPLAKNIKAVKKILKKLGPKPLFIKTTIDLSLPDLEKVLEVCMREKVTGIIDTNTTIDERLKKKYGWGGLPGGLAGNDPIFRKRATQRMKFITQKTRGSGLVRIGVGGIYNAGSAIERLEAGAQILQVVTAIRQKKGKVANEINLGIDEYLQKNGCQSVEEIIGVKA